MKHLTKPLLALAALTGLTGVAQADQAPSWDRVGLTYQEYDLSGSKVDGFGVSATKQVGRNGLIHGSYSSLTDSFRVGSAPNQLSIRFEEDRLTLGLGARQPMSTSTDFFGILSYEELESSINFRDSEEEALEIPFRETGFGLRAGVRSMVTDAIELTASLQHLNTDSDSSTGYQFAGQYLVTDQVSLGLDYSSTSGDKMTGISAYFHF